MPDHNDPLDQTLVLIKPDALKLSLAGYILSILSESHTSLRLAGTKVVQVSHMLAEEHYSDLRDKPFFPSLRDYITGRIHYPTTPQRRRVVALVYCGADAVSRIRAVVGPTNPHKARDDAPNTLRALGTVVMGRDAQGREVIDRIDNLVHASATPAEAEREIKLWFRPNDIVPPMWNYRTVQCDMHYYYLNGRLLTSHQPGSTCLLAPQDLAWATDLEALQAILAGRPSAISLNGVAVKYLINSHQEA